jgi:hypothetical protein
VARLGGWLDWVAKTLPLSRTNWAAALMPDAFARGLPGGLFQAPGQKKLSPRLTPAHLSAHPTPALVAHTQGGITLSLEEGELDADLCQLGI